MTTPTDKLDGLLRQARTAAKTLADELEYALELVREDESLEVDLQQLVLDWNRARTELAMAVFGESRLPPGGLSACETAIGQRRRVADLEVEIARARSELRYLEQSPGGLAAQLADLLGGKRDLVTALVAELAAIAPKPMPTALPAPAAPPIAAKPSESSAVAAPKAMPVAPPGGCGVCQSTKGRLEQFEDRWCCTECLCLEKEVASANRSLIALNARPLEHSVLSASEVPGIAKIRAEGREAMHALAARRRPTGTVASQSQPRTSGKPPRKATPTKRAAANPTVDDLRQRWNSDS
ncbi:hypothetical protein [Rhodococcus sp. ACT016]|uniref:hypothetical protein n=1 Tax=Rhodococcus sp. ACT016 TaxID=3134808 RepID=UPI003D2C598B